MTIMSQKVLSPGAEHFEFTVQVFQPTTAALWIIPVVSSLFWKRTLASIHKIKANYLSLAFKVPKNKQTNKQTLILKKTPSSPAQKLIHSLSCNLRKGKQFVFLLKDEKDEAQRR